MTDREGDPDRAARVARGGLHPDVVEKSFAADLPVGHAVESNSAGEAQVARALRLAQGAHDLEDHFLGKGLDRGGDCCPFHTARGSAGGDDERNRRAFGHAGIGEEFLGLFKILREGVITGVAGVANRNDLLH